MILDMMRMGVEDVADVDQSLSMRSAFRELRAGFDCFLESLRRILVMPGSAVMKAVGT